jgi:orotidine-5'-phosphate decarboxylase
MTFFEKLNLSVNNNNSLLCVGLDTDLDKVPNHLKSEGNPLGAFNKAIIDATHDLVCAYKPNSAYYEALGERGMIHLQKTIEYIHSTYPAIPVIVDAKRADIGSTSEQYARWVFDYLKADAITVNPYLGTDSVESFLKHKDKGIILLCRTSNKGATDFQDLQVEGEPLYMKVAKKIVEWDQAYGNCLMVVGATWPEQMKEIRDIAPDMNFLVPGIGTQGGDLEGTMKAGLRSDKAGLIINSGRSIIYASSSENFAEKAQAEDQKLRDEINTYR